jgi:hypothetical protein
VTTAMSKESWKMHSKSYILLQWKQVFVISWLW